MTLPLTQHSAKLNAMAAAMSSYQAGEVAGALIVLLPLVIVPLSLSVKWVPLHHVRYVMRQRKNWFGPPWIWPTHTYHRTLKPGLRMVVPGLDRVSAPVDWPDRTVAPPPPPEPPDLRDLPGRLGEHP